MKKLIEQIHARANQLRSEYNQQRGGAKVENKELLKIKAQRMIESLEKFKEGLSCE